MDTLYANDKIPIFSIWDILTRLYEYSDFEHKFFLILIKKYPVKMDYF